MILSERLQIQAIADRLSGLAADYSSECFSNPCKRIWLALDNAPPGTLVYDVLSDTMKKYPQLERMIGAILKAQPGDHPGRIPSLAEMGPGLPPVEWVWPGWLPRGMITLLGSAPGAGKSFLALDLSRRILNGETFPDGSPFVCRAPVPKVVYLDAESVPQLLHSRARARQMDLKNLFPLLPPPGRMFDLGLPEQQARLVEVIDAHRPELVILDSLSSISARGENSVEDVRLVLDFLNSLAQHFRIGLLLIHHMRKASGLQARGFEVCIDDFRGSSHIIAMSRSVMGLSVVQTGPELDRNGPRKLEIIKTNLGRYPRPLGFEFAPLQPGSADVYLKWGEAPSPYRAPSMRDECALWLEDLLRQGERRPKEIVDLGAAQGYSRRAVYQARDQLGPAIQNTLGRQHPKNAWKLASDSPLPFREGGPGGLGQ